MQWFSWYWMTFGIHWNNTVLISWTVPNNSSIRINNQLETYLAIFFHIQSLVLALYLTLHGILLLAIKKAYKVKIHMQFRDNTWNIFLDAELHPHAHGFRINTCIWWHHVAKFLLQRSQMVLLSLWYNHTPHFMVLLQQIQHTYHLWAFLMDLQ